MMNSTNYFNEQGLVHFFDGKFYDESEGSKDSECELDLIHENYSFKKHINAKEIVTSNGNG